MNEPILISEAIRAVEIALKACWAATPGRWHFMNHRGSGMRCDCHSIMGEGNGGSLFTVSSNLGIELLRDGSNDSPSPSEAAANADFVVAARAGYAGTLEYLRGRLKGTSDYTDTLTPSIEYYAAIAPIVEWARLGQ